MVMVLMVIMVIQPWFLNSLTRQLNSCFSNLFVESNFEQIRFYFSFRIPQSVKKDEK